MSTVVLVRQLPDVQHVIAADEYLAQGAVGDTRNKLFCFVQLQVKVVVRGHERTSIFGAVELKLDAYTMVDQAFEERLRVHRLHRADITALAHCLVVL